MLSSNGDPDDPHRHPLDRPPNSASSSAAHRPRGSPPRPPRSPSAPFSSSSVLTLLPALVLFLAIGPVFAQIDPNWAANLSVASTTNSGQTGANSSTPAVTDPTTKSSNRSGWNPSAANNPGTNARIPQSITGTCQAYLARLNSNPRFQACANPLLNATATISKGGPQSIKPDQVKSTLDTVCQSKNGCQPMMIHTILNHLTGNCSHELYLGDPVVRTLYDVLYILTPYRVAMCSKDPSTGSYCSSVIASAVINKTAADKGKEKYMSSTDFGSMVSSVFSSDKLVTQLSQSSLVRRDEPSSPDQPTANSTVDPTAITVSNNIAHTNLSQNPNSNFYHPNSNAFTTTNLAFLFLSPNLSTNALCAPCTQSVLGAYVGFEQSNPPFGGLASSGYLSGQWALWSSIKDRCGSSFIQSIEKNAGVMNSLINASSGAAGRAANTDGLALKLLIPVFSLFVVGFLF